MSRQVPFGEDSIHINEDLILPATYLTQAKSGMLVRSGVRSTVTVLGRVDENIDGFYASELDVSRLNKIHKYLWLAGLERPARPLHQQIAIGRRVVLTESADLHLLWKGDRIYIKPLPDFLLSYSAWKGIISPNRELHERASGFLLSYIWLICHRSDLNLAHEHGLLSTSIDWATWAAFSRSVAEHLDFENLRGINVRYRHGELRLARINWIYRFSSHTRSLTSLLRGYLPGYYQYDSFIGSHLAWLLSATAYAVLVLTAMQVGLATDFLRSNTAFQRASYGFTVFSILGPIIAVLIVLLVTLVMILFNARYTLGHRRNWAGTPASDDPHPSSDKVWHGEDPEQ